MALERVCDDVSKTGGHEFVPAGVDGERPESSVVHLACNSTRVVDYPLGQRLAHATTPSCSQDHGWPKQPKFGVAPPDQGFGTDEAWVLELEDWL